jgi:hypothetical protein
MKEKVENYSSETLNSKNLIEFIKMLNTISGWSTSNP